MTPSDILKKYWHYDAFRPLQEDIIHSVMEGHDTLVLLPTGGGKSICYQVPALMKEGVCLVVSPLIALMKDQVENLKSRGIKSGCLVSGMNRYEQEMVLNNCLYGKLKILYVSPERLKSIAFLDVLRRMKISMIAIDEAHCISQWGYDFRPSYLQIAAIRSIHPKSPVMALTATATPAVVNDICQQLAMKDEQRFIASFYRENLAYMVIEEYDKKGRMLRIINKLGGCGIVYVQMRRQTKEIAAYLQSNGIRCGYYHAGMSTKDRDESQRKWMKGEIQTMVSTNAFGMGIDKPDVRYVIHLYIPCSLEEYFQEAGRAGRDGKKSYAILLYKNSDIDHLDLFHQQSYPAIQQIKDIYRAICNHYQVPEGSGEGAQYDFNLEQLCSAYKFNATTFYSAVRFLEREGYLSVPDREEAESSLHILLDREQAYKYVLSSPRYGQLIETLMRMYGGIFSDFEPINENSIARRMELNEEEVAKRLQHLDALKIISYKKKAKGPQIYFTSPRIDTRNMFLGNNNYLIVVEHAAERKEAVKRYIAATQGCRSNMLLSYFGETPEGSCGRCDLCIVENKKNKEEIQQQIINILKEGRMPAADLAFRCKGVTLDAINREIKSMLDNRLINIDENLNLFI